MNAKAATAARTFAWDRLAREALTDSFRKLNLRHQLRNPVMFVVYVGSWLVLALFVRDLIIHKPALATFTGVVDAWLWLTLLFASFSESLAEGQGKAQAASLRQARQEVEAKRLKEPRPRQPVREGDGHGPAHRRSCPRAGRRHHPFGRRGGRGHRLGRRERDHR